MQPPYIVFELNFMPGLLKEPIVLTPQNPKWEVVIRSLQRIGVSDWRKHYDNLEVCDGFSWSLKINTPQLKLRSSGSNDAPDAFEKVRALLEAAADDD